MISPAAPSDSVYLFVYTQRYDACNMTSGRAHLGLCSIAFCRFARPNIYDLVVTLILETDILSMASPKEFLYQLFAIVFKKKLTLTRHLWQNVLYAMRIPEAEAARLIELSFFLVYM